MYLLGTQTYSYTSKDIHVQYWGGYWQLLAMPSTLTDTQGLTVVSLVSSASPVKRESS